MRFRRILFALALLLLIPRYAYSQCTPLLADSFDSGAISASWGEPLGYNALDYTPNTGESIFVSSPTHSGAKAIHIYIRAGTNEDAPITLGMTSGTTLCDLFGGTCPTEITFEWWSYFDPSYPWPTSSQKMVRAYYDDGGVHPESKKEYGIQVQNSNSDINIQGFCGQWGNSTNCNVGFALNSGVSHPLGSWVKFDYYIKMNTPGSSNGIIQLYKDDVLLIGNSAIDLRGNDTRGINGIWVGGNYSMLSGGTAPSNGHRYIDDVKIFSTLPSGCATPTPTPAPSNDGGGYNAYFNRGMKR